MEQQSVTQKEENRTEGYLTFALDNEAFGVRICDVTEIIGVQPITPLPNLPTHIKGIINLRGRVVPVIDMRIKFCKPITDYTDRTCIIVIEISALTVGLIVDRVTEVTSVQTDDIMHPPRQSGLTVQSKYIEGIGQVNGEIVLLLDCEKLLEEEHLLEELPEK